ncbi:hypothetical protein EMPS_07859 [Entomortierella parvispora]|uniref:GRAM domain-containing protein n=1 Tax=Entomortierella parvispora TaxID=205924 RepID=A0A9P3HEX7_9FUNG|nr:hypothetical protein EMPS_07859 [Entomortierella parvispora]
MSVPPPLPQRRPLSTNSLGSETAQDRLLNSPSITTDACHESSSLEGTELTRPSPVQSAPTLFLTPASSSGSSVMNGAYPSVQAQPHSGLDSAFATRTAQSHQNAQLARNKEEVSFQFDRQVQEIRRRRTVAKKTPRPDRDNFTRIESETGKRVLDVQLYIWAYFTYFVESLARDDKVQKAGPLQWSKIRALLSRLYDTSSPAQSLGLYVEHIMYWKSPLLTTAWCTLYFSLWFYKLWLPGFISLFLLKIINNRFGLLDNFKEILQIPDTRSHLNQSDGTKGKEPRRSTKMHSQLRELIHSKDLTDWISQMTKIWGPYGQALLDENISYLERLKNLIHWEKPDQTWRVVTLLVFYIFISTFFQFMVVPAVGFFIGVEFFFLLPLQKFYPRFSHVFSPVEWILWGVPTNAELVVEQMTRQQEDRELRQQAVLSESDSQYPCGGPSPSSAAFRSTAVTNAMIGATAGVASAVASQSSVEEIKRMEQRQEFSPWHLDEIQDDRDTNQKDSASFMASLSPASKIKYEYQKRTRRARSGSNVSSGSMDIMHSPEEPQERSEFHCILRGKPGKLIITEEALLFRSSKLLGRETELQIHWEDIDTIRKSKSMNLGIWSMPGLDVTDVDGRVLAFQNVVHRDEAFRKLVVTSGKKWTHVA